jgi:hypothetical protein
MHVAKNILAPGLGQLPRLASTFSLLPPGDTRA